MKTFREFYNICEGKKKELVAAYLAGREQASPEIKYYGDSAPNSPERDAQIKAMMRDSGGGSVRRAQKQKLKQAVKAVKKIQKEESILEDIKQRTMQLRRRQQQQMQAHKDEVSSYQSRQKKKRAAAQEREELKKEIKRELKANT